MRLSGREGTEERQRAGARPFPLRLLRSCASHSHVCGSGQIFTVKVREVKPLFSALVCSASDQDRSAQSSCCLVRSENDGICKTRGWVEETSRLAGGQGFLEASCPPRVGCTQGRTLGHGRESRRQRRQALPSLSAANCSFSFY